MLSLYPHDLVIQKTREQWISYKNKPSAKCYLNSFPQIESLKCDVELNIGMKKIISFSILILFKLYLYRIIYSWAQTCSQDLLINMWWFCFNSNLEMWMKWKCSPKYLNILICLIVRPLNGKLVFVSLWGHL